MFVSDHEEATFCPDCQRYRVACAHQGGESQ